MDNNNLQTDFNLSALQDARRRVRKLILDIAYKKHAHHLGSALSCVDILVVLYFWTMRLNPDNPNQADRDKFILSKGHAALAQYAVLAERGFFPVQRLNKYGDNDSGLGTHLDKGSVPGVEVSTGSLGHGLSIGAGLALAAKKDKMATRVFVMMGDGECNEGSVWETIMFAAHWHLDNLIAVIDCNKWQGFGSTDEVLNLNPLAEKLKSFGWAVKEIDGHNLAEIAAAFSDLPLQAGQPTVIIAHTTKGRGLGQMENSLESHYLILDEVQYREALSQLERSE